MHVLIVSRTGAHQKAVQAMCAATSQFTRIETAQSPEQVLERVASHRPNLVILGANLDESQASDLASIIKHGPNPPYCIALTLTEFDTGLQQRLLVDKILPTSSFANSLPEILSEALKSSDGLA